MTIDTITNALMQSIEIPVLTIFSKTISYLFDPIILIIISVLISIYLYCKVSKKQGIFFALTILATGVLIKISKEVFQKARPLNALITESSFSMPSGHAMMAVVFFGFVTYLFIDKKYKISAMIISAIIVLLVGFTRIYLRVHWLTDVIVGFVLGGIILTATILIYKKI